MAAAATGAEASTIEVRTIQRSNTVAPYDTDGDGLLDPLEKVMKQYDTDKSGTFSAAEVKLIVRCLPSLDHGPGERAPKKPWIMVQASALQKSGLSRKRLSPALAGE